MAGFPSNSGYACFPGDIGNCLKMRIENRDGVVTEGELKEEIQRRADRNLDGILTQEELQNAFRSGAFERRK